MCGTKSHAYWSYNSPQRPIFTKQKVVADAKRVQRGSPPFVKRAYSASGRISAPPVDPVVDMIAFAAMERA